jgi:hypothetical protein
LYVLVLYVLFLKVLEFVGYALKPLRLQPFVACCRLVVEASADASCMICWLMCWISRSQPKRLLLMLYLSVLQAGRLLERPLTLPASREAAAMDAFTLQQQQNDSAQGGLDNSSSSSAQGQQGQQEKAAGAAAAGSGGKAAAEAAGLPNQVAEGDAEGGGSQVGDCSNAPEPGARQCILFHKCLSVH